MTAEAHAMRVKKKVSDVSLDSLDFSEISDEASLDICPPGGTPFSKLLLCLTPRTSMKHQFPAFEHETQVAEEEEEEEEGKLFSV